MQRETFRPEGMAIPASPYSSVVASGDLVYTAGQVAQGEDGSIVSDDFAEQTHHVFRNLERCLAAAGCTLADAIKLNAYLTDLGNFAAFNDIYRQYVPEPFPARTTVGAPLAPGYLVEIEAIARRPTG